MVSVIQTWSPGPDPGGGDPERQYFSPPIGAGWTNLQVSVSYAPPNWSGSFRIVPQGTLWFNRFPQPASPFGAADPDPLYVTGASDQMEWTCNNGVAGAAPTFQLQGDPATGNPHCVYGTQLQTGASLVYYITPALIDVWLTSEGLIWLAPLFTTLWFTTINTQSLCGSGPPDLPVIDLNTLSASPQQIATILDAVAWPNVCQCVPGSPSPIPFPPPSANQPTGWPTQPQLPCADTDLCAALVAIQQQLQGMQQQIVQTGSLVTLLQRYGLPFAYIMGAVHSHLTGTGSFAVSRLVGVMIRVTQPPTDPRVGMGNPPYVYDQGWASVLDGNGFIDERRIHATNQIWLPKLMQDAVLFGYSLNPGVEIQVTELEAEP